MIDPETRDIVQNIFRRRVDETDGKLANVEFETIPMVKDPWKELNPPKCFATSVIFDWICVKSSCCQPVRSWVPEGGC
jgi:hypothetical protein